uniref:Sodium channel protein Nach n=1 Tax=Parastrongyloides trichosuri TaxID=131310 RepID=A0A0N4Z4W9_PARTI
MKLEDENVVKSIDETFDFENRRFVRNNTQDNKNFLKEKIVLHVYDDESKEFTSLTTYHGMVRIYNSATWPSIIFWCLVVVICVTLFMIHSGMLLTFYASRPTFIQEKLWNRAHVDVKPTITVCKKYFQDPSKIYKYNISKDNQAFLYDIVHRDNIHRKGVFEFDKWVNFEKQYYLNVGKKFSLSKYLLDTSFECENLFSGAWIGSKYNENICANRSKKILTEDGVCWQLKNINGESSKRLFALNINMHSLKDEIIIQVHREGIPANLPAKGVRVSNGKRIIISLVVKNQTFLDKNNWGNCRLNDFNEKHSLSLNKFTDMEGCIKICRRKQYLDKCNCAPVSYTIDHDTEEECNVWEMKNCIRKLETGNQLKNCYCPIECKRIVYDYTSVSYTNLPYHMKNFTAVEINWENWLTSEQKQTKRITAVDLLSYVAGSMGLFLGMSCVTLLEIFMFLFKSVWGMVNSARHKQYYINLLEGNIDKTKDNLDENENYNDSIYLSRKHE